MYILTEWDESIVLHSKDGLYSADSILLQVTDRYRTHVAEGKMGESIIPISCFFSEMLVSGQCELACEAVLPLITCPYASPKVGGTILKKLPILPTSEMAEVSLGYVEGSLGYLWVELGMSMEKISDYKAADNQKKFSPHVTVESQVHSVSEYNTAFPCEVVSRSDMFQKVPTHVELFHFTPHYDGLVFFEDIHESTGGVRSKANAKKSLLHQFTHYFSTNGVDYVEYHVYENQRRALLEWGSRHLLPFERPAYTDETGSFSCPFNNHDIKFKPQEGYEWHEESSGQWLVDKEYTKTDENGWVYGSDFGFIMQNLRLGNVSSLPQLSSVRRRRWMRIAAKVIKNGSIATMKDDIVDNKHHEIFHVFNNERRSVLKLSFGPNNLFPTDRDAFTNESGEHSYPHCKSIEDMVPPTGYKWAADSEWKIDKTYTETDDDGWAYA